MGVLAASGATPALVDTAYLAELASSGDALAFGWIAPAISSMTPALLLDSLTGIRYVVDLRRTAVPVGRRRGARRARSPPGRRPEAQDDGPRRDRLGRGAARCRLDRCSTCSSAGRCRSST